MEATPCRRVAYLSMSEELRKKYDAHHDVYTIEPMCKHGWIVDPFVDWRACRSIDWAQYAAVVVRTTWDYQENLPEFLQCLDHLEMLEKRSAMRLFNDAATMRWNIDKRYLVDLARDGVPVVPSVWSGDRDAPASDRLSLRRVLSEACDAFPECQSFVIKPTVSACAWNTFRFRISDHRGDRGAVENGGDADACTVAVHVRRYPGLGAAAAPRADSCAGATTNYDNCDDCWMSPEESMEKLREVFDAPSALSPHFLIQPFLSSVWEGEISVFLCRGRVTHALLKVPLRDDFRSQEEFGGSLTVWRKDECPNDVLAATSVLLERCPRVASLLYARADFLYDDPPPLCGGTATRPPRQLLLSELELIEPSLYFQLAPEAAEAFAEAFSELMCG